MKFRLYVDEVGNSDMASSDDPNHRYLSLTGVGMSLSYVADEFHNALEGLKRKYFGSHPDDPVILHRKEMVNRRGPFHVLSSESVRREFEQELLGLMRSAPYVVFTATIDKKEHFVRYGEWHYHPYHYTLEVLLERYVRWLETQRGEGDVMAESRGKREDLELKAVFRGLWESGTRFVSAQRFQRVLTSCELKVKPKSMNIAGLQLADLIAHAAFNYCLREFVGVDRLKPFGREIVGVLVGEKFHRREDGMVNGYGAKWLP